jgi:hypothetical protein
MVLPKQNAKFKSTSTLEAAGNQAQQKLTKYAIAGRW